MERVADFIFPEAEYPQENRDLFYMLRKGRAQMGGRILAGAGSEHGNLLNCFVQDGAPYEPGGTAWVLQLSKRLAQVTKVGGGNGLNLDPIPAKSPFAPEENDTSNFAIGNVHLAIAESHPDAENVLAGRFFDQARGEYLTPGYHTVREVRTIPEGLLPEELGPDTDFERFLRHMDAPSDTVVVYAHDSIEGIWDAANEMIQYMTLGYDVVVVLSALRAEGTPVKGSGGTSSGAASFAVEIFDNFARWMRLGGAGYAGPVATLRYIFAPTLRVIRQGGTRRGAGMATLSATHPDLLDFITAKDLERERTEGDISTFNISVLASADFMDEALEAPESTAGQELAIIAEQAWATGEPGLIYIDTINATNPLAPIDGPIVATNPCGEIPLYPGEPCDLAALNLAAYWNAEQGDLDWDQLLHDTRVMVHALDRVLDLENPPTPEIAAAIADKRRIGLGVMGVADLLVLAGFRYDSDEGREFVGTVMGEITNEAIKTSEELGKRYGVPNGVMRALTTAPHGGAFTPRRNIAVMTVAPTGTISMMTGVSSGIEPIYSALTYRRIGTDYHRIIHPLLKQLLYEHDGDGRYWKETQDGNFWDWDRIVADLADHEGQLTPLLRHLPDDPRLQAFVTAHEVAPLDHVWMQSTVQNAFDQPLDGPLSYAGNSISKTINLPHKASQHDVLTVYAEAYYGNAKGVTVYRDGSRSLQVLSTSAPVAEKTAEDQAWLDGSAEDLGRALDAHERPFEELEQVVVASAVRDGRDPSEPDPAEEHLKQEVSEIFETFVRETKRHIAEYEGKKGAVAWRARPQAVPGESHKYEINGGKLYVQVFANDELELVEAWTPAPKGSTSHERTSHEIIGRLVSLALKYGAPTLKIAEALQGHMDDTGGIVRGVGYVGSRWDLVAHTLLRFEEHLSNERQGRDAELQERLTVPAIEAAQSGRLQPEFGYAAGIGPICADCGSDHVAYVDGCMTCQVCGSSKCG